MSVTFPQFLIQLQQQPVQFFADHISYHRMSLEKYRNNPLFNIRSPNFTLDVATYEGLPIECCRALLIDSDVRWLPGNPLTLRQEFRLKSAILSNNDGVHRNEWEDQQFVRSMGNYLSFQLEALALWSLEVIESFLSWCFKNLGRLLTQFFTAIAVLSFSTLGVLMVFRMMSALVNSEGEGGSLTSIDSGFCDFVAPDANVTSTTILLDSPEDPRNVDTTNGPENEQKPSFLTSLSNLITNTDELSSSTLQILSTVQFLKSSTGTIKEAYENLAVTSLPPGDKLVMQHKLLREQIIHLTKIFNTYDSAVESNFDSTQDKLGYIGKCTAVVDQMDSSECTQLQWLRLLSFVVPPWCYSAQYFQKRPKRYCAGLLLGIPETYCPLENTSFPLTQLCYPLQSFRSYLTCATHKDTSEYITASQNLRQGISVLLEALDEQISNLIILADESYEALYSVVVNNREIPNLYKVNENTILDQISTLRAKFDPKSAAAAKKKTKAKAKVKKQKTSTGQSDNQEDNQDLEIPKPQQPQPKIPLKIKQRKDLETLLQYLKVVTICQGAIIRFEENGLLDLMRSISDRLIEIRNSIKDMTFDFNEKESKESTSSLYLPISELQPLIIKQTKQTSTHVSKRKLILSSTHFSSQKPLNKQPRAQAFWGTYYKLVKTDAKTGKRSVETFPWDVFFKERYSRNVEEGGRREDVVELLEWVGSAIEIN